MEGGDGAAGQLLGFLLSVLWLYWLSFGGDRFHKHTWRLHQPFLVGKWNLSKPDCAPMKTWPFSIAELHDTESV